MCFLRISVILLIDSMCLCINRHRCLFVPTEAEPDGGYPSSLGYGHPDEQRHTHAGARRGVWI